MKMAWFTDIHLDHLESKDIEIFLRQIADIDADIFVISGDIANGNSCAKFLSDITDAAGKTVYFVLGNHDFYESSFRQVKYSIKELAEAKSDLVWLSKSGIVSLSEKTALIGHEGWADGHLGDYDRSDLVLNDYLLIKEFRPMGLANNIGLRSKSERLILMQRLAEESSAHFKLYLEKALESYESVIALTHVPPFKEACWHMGEISDDNSLPHFACKTVGDSMRAIMEKHPDKKLKVLCGHTHSAGIAKILANLEVITGSAEYGVPTVQQIINIE